MVKLYEILNMLTAFQLFFFALVLFITCRKRLWSRLILGIFFAAQAFATAEYLINMNFDFFYYNFPHIIYIGSTFEFLFGPALYFYIKSRTEKNFKFSPLHALHLIPFLLFFGFTVIYHDFLVFQFSILDRYHSLRIQMTYLINIIIFIQVISYLIFILVKLHRYGLEVKKWFSNLKNNNLAWLRTVIFGFICMWGTSMAYMFMLRFIDRSSFIFSFLDLLKRTIMFSFTNYVVYKNLTEKVVFFGDDDKNAKNLPAARINYYQKILDQYMKNEKPYLVPTLTINDLSDKVDIPVRDLSRLLNDFYGKNFFDFVNSYRISDAKKLLAFPEDKKITVLEILYEVGFNSKSAFNAVFKKQTGMTPTQYKKMKILEISHKN